MHVHSGHPCEYTWYCSAAHETMEIPDMEAVKTENSGNFYGEKPTAQSTQEMI